nr:LuxR C-terminal-related transcriptional regulator [Nocardioides panaciterrulae]
MLISLKTVRNHVSNVLPKLQVADRAAAIVRCAERARPTRTEAPAGEDRARKAPGKVTSRRCLGSPAAREER